MEERLEESEIWRERRRVKEAGKEHRDGAKCSVSPFWAIVIMDNFHREPTESKPEVTEKRPQANCPSIPISAYTHSSAVTRRLCLLPPAWSSLLSSSPLLKFWTCQNVWGNEVKRIPKPKLKGREETLAVSTSRKSENTGRGDAVVRAFLLV